MRDKRRGAKASSGDVTQRQSGFSGGSATLKEIGLPAALKNGGYNFLDPNEPQGSKAKDQVAHQALGADYYLMSSNAIAATGELVNIDGYGNRVAALIFGPKNVIVIAGMNKVAPDLDAASTSRQKLCRAADHADLQAGLFLF